MSFWLQQYSIIFRDLFSNIWQQWYLYITKPSFFTWCLYPIQDISIDIYNPLISILNNDKYLYWRFTNSFFKFAYTASPCNYSISYLSVCIWLPCQVCVFWVHWTSNNFGFDFLKLLSTITKCHDFRWTYKSTAK